MKRLKKGDEVLVITGNYKGSKGKILKVMPERVVVQGVNKVKRHQKPQSRGESGRIVEFESSIHISNVARCSPKKDEKSGDIESSKTKKEV